MVVLGGGAVSYERGAPVQLLLPRKLLLREGRLRFGEITTYAERTTSELGGDLGGGDNCVCRGTAA